MCASAVFDADARAAEHVAAVARDVEGHASFSTSRARPAWATSRSRGVRAAGQELCVVMPAHVGETLNWLLGWLPPGLARPGRRSAPWARLRSADDAPKMP